MKFTSVRKFVCALSLTSIFSIGFASWTISTPTVTPEEIFGGIQADYVIKADDYVAFENLDTQTEGDGVVLPEYNAVGFVTTTIKDGKTVYANSSTANMILHLVVDYENCQKLKALEETKMDISITFTLQTNASAFFNDTLTEIRSLGSSGIGSAMPWITKNTAVMSGKTVTMGYTILLEGYDFKNLTQDGKIKLTITFDSTGHEDSVKDCLNENQFVFNTRVHSY